MTATTQPAGRDWTPPVFALMLAGLALVVAPLLPFGAASSTFVGTISRTGVELIGPEVLLLSLIGAALLIAGWQRSTGQFRSRASVFVPALAAVGLTAWYFSQVNQRVTDVASEAAVASLGAGMWLALAAAVAAAAIGLFSNTRRVPAR